MPTMILVEDESFERSSLVNCVDWGLVGVSIIGEAANGLQALSLVEKLHPDIVLTDVKMPVMSGIELSKRIRQTQSETKIIFLSSYDDFEYAKQAIDLNIQAYVMKPVNEGELLRVIKKVADEITEKALETRMYNKIKNNYTISMNLARQALVNRLIVGLQTCEDDARNLGLEWLCVPSCDLCLFLSFYDITKLASIDEKISILNRSCLQVCGQSINVCINAGTVITFCAFLPETRNALMRNVYEILQSFFEGIGGRQVRIESMHGNEILNTPAKLHTAILKRSISGYSEPDTLLEKKKNKQQIADEVEKIIATQYSNPLTLESIARMMHFTPNYIGTVFKSLKKISVNRYLMKVRLQKAQELLGNNELALNDIAELCGFGSITYFHTIFKKEKGVTPGEYRQRMMGE